MPKVAAGEIVVTVKSLIQVRQKNVVIFKGSFFALLFISKRKEFEVFEGTSSPTIPATPWQNLIRLMLVEFVTLWHAIVGSNHESLSDKI